MNRDHVLSLMNQHLEAIRERFRVKDLALFGSVARDEMREGSDIDVLVTFDGPPTFDGYMDLKFYLETLFGAKVDLVTEGSIKPRMRPVIERDLIHVP